MIKSLAGLASWVNPTNLVIGAVALSATGIGIAAYRASLINKGFEQGRNSVIVEQLKADNHSMRLQADRIIVLTNDLATAKASYEKFASNLQTSRGSAAVTGDRLRKQTDSDLDSRIANTQCPVVREVAAGALRTAITCRGYVADLGLGIGGLVESTNSAYYEHGRAEALMKFKMPTSPFKPN